MASVRRIGTNERIRTFGPDGGGYDFMPSTFTVNESGTLTSNSTTNANGDTVLTDSTKSWTPDSLIGCYAKNVTTGRTDTVIANTATTVTMTTGFISGSTGNSYTIQASGLWAWANDIAQRDMVAATQSETLEIYGDGSQLTTYDFSSYGATLVIGGFTSNSTYFPVMRPATGHYHDGTPNAGVAIITGFQGLSLDGDYAQCQDLILRNTDQTTTSAVTPMHFDTNFDQVNGPTQAAFVGCVSDTSGIRAGNASTITTGNATDNCYVINCLLYHTSCRYIATLNGGTINFINCTTAGTAPTEAGYAVATNPVTVNLTNCIEYSQTSIGSSGTFNRTTCLAKNTTTGYADHTNRDYHITASLGTATDMSSDVNYPFDDDIDREIINTWEIGFDAIDVITGPGDLTYTIVGPISVRWREKDTETWLTSGSTLSNIDPGSITIEFLEIPDYIKPDDIIINIRAGNEIYKNAQYTHETDTIILIDNPAGIKWRLSTDSPETRRDYGTSVDVGIGGTFDIICYGVDGYSTPETMTGISVIDTNDNEERTAIYFEIVSGLLIEGASIDFIMQQLQDAGYVGSLNDMLLQYYNVQNSRSDTCLEDAALIFYRGLTYTGSLPDMIYAKAKDDGTI